MTLFQAVVLGLIQGLTEFLPVSSTAHLVITQNFFGLKGPILLIFDVVVHVGTLLSLFVYFGWEFLKLRRGQVFSPSPFSSPPSAKILADPCLAGRQASSGGEGGEGRSEVVLGARLFWLVIVATIPTGIIGIFLKDWTEANFNSLMITVVTLLINSVILWSTKWVRRGNAPLPTSPRASGGSLPAGQAGIEVGGEMTWLDAAWIGIAQGISILPGISRSGATVAAALWLNIKAEKATRFSFLIAIPAIIGATVFVLPRSLEFMSKDLWPIMTTGFVAAFVSGYAAIVILFRVVSRGQFHYFAIYTFFLAIVTFLFSSNSLSLF